MLIFSSNNRNQLWSSVFVQFRCFSSDVLWLCVCKPWIFLSFSDGWTQALILAALHLVRWSDKCLPPPNTPLSNSSGRRHRLEALFYYLRYYLLLHLSSLILRWCVSVSGCLRVSFILGHWHCSLKHCHTHCCKTLKDTDSCQTRPLLASGTECFCSNTGIGLLSQITAASVNCFGLCPHELLVQHLKMHHKEPMKSKLQFGSCLSVPVNLKVI